MAKYLLSSAAYEDIANIADYTINAFGINQARRYRDALEACFQLLANNPGFGRNAEALAPNLHRHEHQSHVVFYLKNETGVLIVRVLHKNMDFEQYL